MAQQIFDEYDVDDSKILTADEFTNLLQVTIQAAGPGC